MAGRPRTVIPRTELGRQLDKEIANRGLTLGEAAKQIGCARQSITAWFRGAEPDVISMRRIASFLDVSPATVIGWILSDDDSVNPGELHSVSRPDTRMRLDRRRLVTAAA